MKSLTVLIVASIVIQYLVERVKDFIPNNTYSKLITYVKPSVFSLIFGLLIAFGCKIDLFDVVGYSINPVWLGYILTAIALSGGSVGINELIKSLSSIKESKSAEAKMLENPVVLNETVVDETTEG